MQGETVLCVAPRDWHGLWKETQSIMLRIAAQNRVIYFDPGRDSQRPALAEFMDNLPNFFVLRTNDIEDNLIVIPTPATIPLARRHLPRPVLQITMPLIIKINTFFLIRHIRRAVKALQIKSPILWLNSPYHVSLIGKFGEKLACYFNYDEFADFVANQRIKELVRQYDIELTSRVDVVFATSQAQTNVRKAFNAHTYFVPNAVNFELFNRALMPDLPIPDDIVRIPHPIVGYAGRMAESNIDIELLRRIAEAYPTYSLVLIGPDELPHTPDDKVLRTLPNVYFLGWKEASQLPNYLQAFDAALIPYRLVGHVLSGYPTKLHEYLAAGRAVVATAMPELRPYGNVIHICETNDEFIRWISEAVQDNTPQVIEARVAVARENTWDQRVAKMSGILQSLLASKNKQNQVEIRAGSRVI